MEPDGCAISKLVNDFRTKSIYLLPVVVSCSSAFVGLSGITEYHKLKWRDDYFYSLDFFVCDFCLHMVLVLILDVGIPLSEPMEIQ